MFLKMEVQKKALDLLVWQNGLTALHLAAKEGHDDAVEFLLKEGAHIEAQDKVRIQIEHVIQCLSIASTLIFEG